MAANATQTADAAQASAAVKAIHAGLFPIPFRKDFGATAWGTTSDQCLLAKIDHGAYVDDFAMRFHGKPDTQYIATVLLVHGSTTTPTVLGTFTGSATQGALTIRGLGQAQRCSVSDEDPVRFGMVVLNIVSGTQTASTSLAGYVSCHIGP